MTMNLDMIAALVSGDSAAKNTSNAEKTMRGNDVDSFARVIEELRAVRQLDMVRSREKAEEAKAEESDEARRKRIQELYALLAQLRSKLSATGFSPALAAQISQLETELFWLLGTV